MYFISCAIIKGIFLIVISDCLLLGYRNTIELCILIFYISPFLNLFISSNRFYVNSLGISVCRIMSSLNRDCCTLPFKSNVLFFFYLSITLASTSNIMLNGHGEHRYFCLFLILEKAFSLSSFSVMLAVGF